MCIYCKVAEIFIVRFETKLKSHPNQARRKKYIADRAFSKAHRKGTCWPFLFGIE